MEEAFTRKRMGTPEWAKRGCESVSGAVSGLLQAVQVAPDNTLWRGNAELKKKPH